MDFLLLPVVPWPTVYSMVNVHQWSNPTSTVSLNGPNVYSHVWFQIHSPSPTTNLPARISRSHCCVMASPGTLTKTSSSATPEWETWRSIKSLKVKWKEEKNIWVFDYISHSFCCWVADFSGTTHPPYWQKPVNELDPDDPTNNGFINDDLIVWMREAAFPNFKKLYGVLCRDNKPFTKGLPAGNYSIEITYSIFTLFIYQIFTVVSLNYKCLRI